MVKIAGEVIDKWERGEGRLTSSSLEVGGCYTDVQASGGRWGDIPGGPSGDVA